MKMALACRVHRRLQREPANRSAPSRERATAPLYPAAASQEVMHGWFDAGLRVVLCSLEAAHFLTNGIPVEYVQEAYTL